MIKFLKIITVTIFLFSYNVYAQDSVIKRDGTEMKVKITDISDTELKYKKQGLSVSFSLNINEVLLVTFENGERMTFENIKSKSNDSSKLITAGTRIPLVMTESISSDRKGGRKVNTGEVITLRVQSDVSDIDGNVLIKQGTLVNGTITNAVKRKAAGTKGKLSFNIVFCL